MASFSKPADIPRWADTGTKTEPSEAQKDSGWTFQQIPSSAQENWKENLTGEWIKWLDERLDDGGTADVFVLSNPAAANDLISFSRTADVITMSFSGTNNLVFDITAASEFFDIRVASATPSSRHRVDRVNVSGGLVVGNADTADLGTGIILATVGLNMNGTTVPESGAGIFTGSIAVGTDANDPNADTGIIINDSNFRLSGANGSDVRFLFDSNDSMFYRRGTNRWEFQVGGVQQWFIDSTAIWPASAGARDLGTDTLYMQTIHAERIEPHGIVQDPVNTRFELGLVNIPTAVVRFGSTGTILGNSWNIATVTNPATGTYSVTFTEAVGSNPAIIATPNNGVGVVRRAAATTNGSAIEVYINDDTGTAQASTASLVVYG